MFVELKYIYIPKNSCPEKPNMAGNVEAPKRSLEERASRAFELAEKIPLSAQIALVERTSGSIKALEKDQLFDTQPVLGGLIKSAIKEENPEALSKIGNLGLGILDKISNIPDVREKRHHFGFQIGKGFETIAKKKKQWILLAEAGKFYQKIYEKEEVQRIRIQLEEFADKTGNWRLLIEAAGLYDDFWQKEEIQRIAIKLGEITKEKDDPLLFVSAGRLLAKNEETREQGIRLIMEGGNLKEAHDLVKYEFKIGGGLRREVEKRAEEAGEDSTWNHRELLNGQGFRSMQVKAWLKEGNPQKALEIALRSDLVKEASEIIQEHDLQEEAEQIIRGLELANAAGLANSLGRPELAFELAERASKYSQKQIETLSQQIWLLQIQVESTEDKEIKEKLKEQLSQKQHLLVDTYLNSGETKTAANYAEKIGNTTLARQIKEAALEKAIELNNHRRAAPLAEELGETDVAINQLIQGKRYSEALRLAIREKRTEAVISLTLAHFKELSIYGIPKVLNFIREEAKDSEQSQSAIETIAKYLKSHYEDSGRFAEAAEMCELLGLPELTAVYKELNSLVPKPVDKGHCYITTACCEVMGLTDDCEILTNLRLLRDNFISRLSDGQDLIGRYYETAPQILAKTTDTELKQLFHKAIKPASDLVKDGNYQEAFELYKKTLQDLILKYLPSASSTI